jgi:hypothetical protein
MAYSRQARHYLLDPRFQIKWTSYLVIVVLAVMAGLGVLIAPPGASSSALPAEPRSRLGRLRAEKLERTAQQGSHVGLGRLRLASLHAA